MKVPWPSWAARESQNGRLLPPAPMPPELAATVDETKRDTAGPPDTPTELRWRLKTLTEIRAHHPRPNTQENPR